MKTKPTYAGNILTSDLQKLPDGTIFYEHLFDGLADEPTLYKKVRNATPYKEWPEGDILVEPLMCGQYSEVPGEQCRLGHTDAQGKEWRVMSRDNIETLIGWLMTSAQCLDDEDS